MKRVFARLLDLEQFGNAEAAHCDTYLIRANQKESIWMNFTDGGTEPILNRRFIQSAIVSFASECLCNGLPA